MAQPPLIIEDPNPFSRARDRPVNRCVIHSMRARFDVEGRTMTAPGFLRHVRLSVHDLISPSGNVYRLVPWDRRASHAKGFNTGSIGVELLVYDEAHGLTYDAFLELIGIHPGTKEMIEPLPNPYTDAQYRSLGWWMAEARRGLTEVRALGDSGFHTHAELDPTRKYDPGPAFSMERALESMREWEKA
jgi:N-acetyl-anhydromuramyl-L-alanine amidase AmpD